MVPIVATIDGIPTLATSKPLIKPSARPSARQSANASKKLSVVVDTMANTQADRPRTDGKDRSISPSETMNVAPMARMPKNGIVDMNER